MVLSGILRRSEGTFFILGIYIPINKNLALEGLKISIMKNIAYLISIVFSIIFLCIFVIGILMVFINDVIYTNECRIWSSAINVIAWHAFKYASFASLFVFIVKTAQRFPKLVNKFEMLRDKYIAEGTEEMIFKIVTYITISVITIGIAVILIMTFTTDFCYYLS